PAPGRFLHRPLRHPLRRRGRLARRPKLPNHRTQRRGLRGHQHLRRAKLALCRLPNTVSAVGTRLRHRRRQPAARLIADPRVLALEEVARNERACCDVSTGGLMYTRSSKLKVQCSKEAPAAKLQSRITTTPALELGAWILELLLNFEL